MKYFGDKSEYHSERSCDLLDAYFRYLKTCTHVSRTETFKGVAQMPATRFWVSKNRAAVVVARIMRGDKLRHMRPNKREMFFEIHRRVMALSRVRPAWSIRRLVETVIAQPAPKFYLSPGSARAIILKAKKQWFAEKSKRLRDCSSRYSL